MDIKTVIFVGPQGSGKGTQIQKLKEVLESKDRRRVVDIQTGRRFRALAAKQETYADRKIAQGIDSGALQPNFLTVVLWGQAMLEQLDDKSHLLIDGFPRNKAQVADLEDAFTFFGRSNLTLVNLNVPEDIVRGRMIVRSRNDDTKESIEERLRWYREDTLPVLDYYRTRKDTTVIDIDGTGTIDEVHAQIVLALGL